VTTFRRALIGLVLFLDGLGLGGLGVYAWLHPLPSPVATVQKLPARRWEATLYLPLEDNQGKRFVPEVWDGALNLLVAEFGGATLGPEQKGCWLDAEKQIRREPIQLVIVSFEQDRLTTFQEVVRQVGRRLRQEAMYVRYEESRIDLIPVGAAGPEKEG
jgi:hypothetical protein